MGSFMAAALSRLFKENEALLTDARIVGTLANEARTFRERVTSTGNGEAAGITFQFRAEFPSASDLDDFHRALQSLASLVREDG